MVTPPPFNSDESQPDEASSQKLTIPTTTSNYNFKTPSSSDSSPIKLHDTSSFKTIIKTHQTDIPSDKLRHPSQNQSNLLPPPIDRTTKTHYNLRHKPKMEYRLLYHRQNSKTNYSFYWFHKNWSRKS